MSLRIRLPAVPDVAELQAAAAIESRLAGRAFDATFEVLIGSAALASGADSFALAALDRFDGF